VNAETVSTVSVSISRPQDVVPGAQKAAIDIYGKTRTPTASCRNYLALTFIVMLTLHPVCIPLFRSRNGTDQSRPRHHTLDHDVNMPLTRSRYWPLHQIPSHPGHHSGATRSASSSLAEPEQRRRTLDAH
jgi:hypothetical protein